MVLKILNKIMYTKVYSILYSIFQGRFRINLGHHTHIPTISVFVCLRQNLGEILIMHYFTQNIFEMINIAFYNFSSSIE